MSPNVAELVAALPDLEDDEESARQDPLREALADLTRRPGPEGGAAPPLGLRRAPGPGRPGLPGVLGAELVPRRRPARAGAGRGPPPRGDQDAADHGLPPRRGDEAGPGAGQPPPHRPRPDRRDARAAALRGAADALRPAARARAGRARAGARRRPSRRSTRGPSRPRRWARSTGPP